MSVSDNRRVEIAACSAETVLFPVSQRLNMIQNVDTVTILWGTHEGSVLMEVATKRAWLPLDAFANANKT